MNDDDELEEKAKEVAELALLALEAFLTGKAELAIKKSPYDGGQSIVFRFLKP